MNKRRSWFWVVIALIAVATFSPGLLQDEWALGFRLGASLLAGWLGLYSAGIQAQVSAARINQNMISSASESIGTLIKAGRSVDNLEESKTAPARELKKAEAHAAGIQILTSLATLALLIMVLWATGDV